MTAYNGELYLAVMEGTDCSELACLTYSYVYYESGGISFLAEEGSSYYVTVAPPYWNSDVGSFNLIAEVR